ncbi:SHQ1 protein-domain-containing protein [Pisolithus marmoratus]|nr:SHQ1 protein-domain-containing protein [Pisolithus marmoratus]
MITPKFSCSQTDESLTTSVYCPSIRAADVEINVDDTVLIAHINPYFLRLNFPYAVVEDDKSSAQYDPSSGYLTITLTKSVKGQHFPDLDLLAKLLAPRLPRPRTGPSIEVLDSRHALTDAITDISNCTDALSLDDEFVQAAKNEWQLPQAVPGPASEFHTSSKRYYGFLDAFTGYFTHVAHSENEINELGDDAEACNIEERRARRIAHENEKWDEEHYMFVSVILPLQLNGDNSCRADYAEDEYIQELNNWHDPDLTSMIEVVITEDEKTAMLRLPRKEYIMDSFQEHNLYLTLITLVFARAYEKRTTLNDPTAESAWTICNLVAAFSALDPPPYSPVAFSSVALDFTEAELTSTLVTSYRRSLAFPLYRSFQLAEQCRRDVAAAFRRGRRLITKYLLGIKNILDHHDVYYVYSKIWVEDFCVWIQTGASDAVLTQIGEKLDALIVPKSAIGWDLEDLEEATRLVVDGDSDSDDESIE